MVSPSKSSVVLVRFPFSDLSSWKLRPSIVIAYVNRDDWILCQVTSNPYSDPFAIRLVDRDFKNGSLQRTSYARPGKLFTANSSLMVSEIGVLKEASLKNIIKSILDILQKPEPKRG